MALFNFKRNKKEKVESGDTLKMMTAFSTQYFAFNGKLYESDIVRSAIRPKSKFVGKMLAKHILEADDGIKVNSKQYLKMLLKYPNPLMSMQQLLEKVTTQLSLNNNAFILIIRDENGYPMSLYPIPCSYVEAIYGKNGSLFLKFTYKNGKHGIFSYNDIIHLREDFSENEIFGTPPSEALFTVLNCVGYIDQGIIAAIKNSGVIKYILRLAQSLRDDSLKAYAKNFVDNYMSIDSENLGVAVVDSKVAEVQEMKTHDYVPNSNVANSLTKRIYNFFNTNEHIISSNWNEEQFNAYYESVLEPLAIQLSDTFTMRLFSRREIALGNSIVFESSNLMTASMRTKLALMGMVDRGALTPDEWRKTLNLAPIEGGDKPIRRLDTAIVESVEEDEEDET